MKQKIRFSQIFINNKKIIYKIINLIKNNKDDCIIEIGSGLGALTIPLLKKIKLLNIIEIDKIMVLNLKNNILVKKKIYFFKLNVIKFNFGIFSINKKKVLRLFGNLPYNISIKIIFHILKYINFIKDMYFMFQKEVADRILSKPNNNKYNSLSILIQYFFKIIHIFNVPSFNFYPIPKVNSTFLHFIPKINFLKLKNINFFKKIIRFFFINKRKKIYNFLSNKNSIRAENISVINYYKLTNFFLNYYEWNLLY